MLLIEASCSGQAQAMAMAQALAAAGAPAACIILRDESEAERTFARLLGTAEGVIRLDPRPDAGQARFKGLPTACIYTAGYAQARSVDVAAWHKKNGVPCFWERIRTAIKKERHISTVLLPSPLPPLPDPGPFGNPRRRPLVGIMTPPLEHEEARVVQREYAAARCRRSGLAVLRPPETLGEAVGKWEHVDIWYVPRTGAQPIWSAEFSEILLRGGEVASVFPPEALKNFVIAVRGYEDVEEAAFNRDRGAMDVTGLQALLGEEFTRAMEHAGLFHRQEETHRQRESGGTT